MVDLKTAFQKADLYVVLVHDIGTNVSNWVDTSNGNLPLLFRYLAVATDSVTRWPEAEAIADKSASTIAKVIVKLICRYTNIRVLITDQGREFANEVNEEICHRLKIDHRLTTAYHPQSKGQTERYLQYLNLAHWGQVICWLYHNWFR